MVHIFPALQQGRFRCFLKINPSDCGSGGHAFRSCSWLTSVSSIVRPAGIRLTQLSDMKWYLALFTGRGICFFELGEQDEEGMSGMGGEGREEGRGEGGFDK